MATYRKLNRRTSFAVLEISCRHQLGLDDACLQHLHRFNSGCEQATASIAKRQTASVYLKQLCEIGVLHEIKSGRENIFVHPKYIELLTGEENVWIFYAGVETDSAVQAVNAD